MMNKHWKQTISSAMKGNKEAFEEICNEVVPDILFICNNVLHNWQDAEDATQEVLTTVHDKIHTLNKPDSFFVWLNRLSYNTAFMMRRKQMKSKYNTSLDEYVDGIYDESLAPLPSELLENKEASMLVMDAIKILPTNYRMAIIFRYYEGMTAKEIAEVMEVSTKTAENYLYQGRLALKKILGNSAVVKENAAFSAILLNAFRQTDLITAAEHGTNVIKAMGIAPQAAASTPPSAAVLSGKMMAASLAGAVFTISIVGVMVTYNLGQGIILDAADTSHSPLLAVQHNNPEPYSYAPSINSTSVFSSSLAPQQPLSEKQDAGFPGPAPVVSEQKGAAMGQIYLHSPQAENEFSAAGLPGITVKLYSADTPDRPMQTTQTMSGLHTGWYLFDNLVPGKYIARIEIPPYWEYEETGDGSMQDGQIAFEVQPAQVASLHIPLRQKGNISGKIVANPLESEGNLEGITVKLYDFENHLVMETSTGPDGSYTFLSPPAASQEKYTLRFSIPTNRSAAISQEAVLIDFSPGENKEVGSITLTTVLPSALNVEVPGSAKFPVTTRENAFTIICSGMETAVPEWKVENSDGTVVAAGQGFTPGNKLNALPAGNYILSVSVTDTASHTATTQKIIYLG